jgi:hypothetical protein
MGPKFVSGSQWAATRMQRRIGEKDACNAAHSRIAQHRDDKESTKKAPHSEAGTAFLHDRFPRSTIRSANPHRRPDIHVSRIIVCFLTGAQFGL